MKKYAFHFIYILIIAALAYQLLSKSVEDGEVVEGGGVNVMGTQQDEGTNIEGILIRGLEYELDGNMKDALILYRKAFDTSTERGLILTNIRFHIGRVLYMMEAHVRSYDELSKYIAETDREVSSGGMSNNKLKRNRNRAKSMLSESRKFVEGNVDPNREVKLLLEKHGYRRPSIYDMCGFSTSDDFFFIQQGVAYTLDVRMKVGAEVCTRLGTAKVVDWRTVPGYIHGELVDVYYPLLDTAAKVGHIGACKGESGTIISSGSMNEMPPPMADMIRQKALKTFIASAKAALESGQYIKDESMKLYMKELLESGAIPEMEFKSSIFNSGGVLRGYVEANVFDTVRLLEGDQLASSLNSGQNARLKLAVMRMEIADSDFRALQAGERSGTESFIAEFKVEDAAWHTMDVSPRYLGERLIHSPIPMTAYDLDGDLKLEHWEEGHGAESYEESYHEEGEGSVASYGCGA